jgi:hypothetical protein
MSPATGKAGYILTILQRAVGHDPRCRFGLLYDAFDRATDEILGGRVLPFDRTTAKTAAAIAARQR